MSVAPAPGANVPARSEGTVVAELVGATARIGLNRPEKLNAIDARVLDGLEAAMDWAEGEPRVRAVVVHGAGKAFSAGGDLASLTGIVHDRERLDAFFERWHAVYARIERSPLPSVAAAHGVVFAGGLELTQVCDFVVAGDRTVIGDQHANYGLFPAGGSTQRLPRLIGLRQAKWLLMSGETIDPQTAQAIGLVNRVVPEERVLAEAMSMAERLASKSAAATAAIKQALHRGLGRPLDDALAAERELAVRHQGSEDAAAGFAAFQDRRVPEFPDRE